jgi:hypothetical protein
MALHHQTLKAAVNKYGPLHDSGQSEQEIRNAIKSDEKGFDKDEVEEIYAAIVDPERKEDADAPEAEDGKSTKKGAGKKAVYKVKTPFKDINDFAKQWNEGDDVSHFEQERLKNLEDLGYIEKK